MDFFYFWVWAWKCSRWLYGQNNEIKTFTTTENHFIWNSRVITVKKVTLKDLYWILITTIEHKPTSQKYFGKRFTYLSLDWKEVYMIPRIVSNNAYMVCFQYKVLNNALFLYKKLFLFKKSNSPLCFFCKEDETGFHPYFYCPSVRNFWNFHLSGNLVLPPQNCKLLFLAYTSKTIPKT